MAKVLYAPAALLMLASGVTAAVRTASPSRADLDLTHRHVDSSLFALKAFACMQPSLCPPSLWRLGYPVAIDKSGTDLGPTTARRL